MYAARRLFRRKPLQRVGIGCGAIGDPDLSGIAHHDRQRRTLPFDSFAESVLQRIACSVRHPVDPQSVAVEHDVIGIVLRQYVQYRRPAHTLAHEIEREVEIDMSHAGHLRLCKGLRVDRFRRSQYRRHHAFGLRGLGDGRCLHHGRRGARGGCGRKKDGEDRAMHGKTPVRYLKLFDWLPA